MFGISLKILQHLYHIGKVFNGFGIGYLERYKGGREMMDKYRMTYHMGMAYGVLYGISMRPDVPADVRKKCIELVKIYREEYDSHKNKERDE